MDPPSTGSIAGIVGAGGNTGAVCFGLGFRNLSYYKAFVVMGSCIVASSILSFMIFIKGEAALLCGKATPKEEKKTINVPAGQQTNYVEEGASSDEVEA